MYICGLIPQNFAEIAEAVSIACCRVAGCVLRLFFIVQWIGHWSEIV